MQRRALSFLGLWRQRAFGDLGGVPPGAVLRFEQDDVAVGDCQRLSIHDVVGGGISVNSITASSAIINWTTIVPATSQVNYGISVSYGLSTLVDATLGTSHSMILYGLAPGTVYHYQVRSGTTGEILLHQETMLLQLQVLLPHLAH
jgi:hypothetical protein